METGLDGDGDRGPTRKSGERDWLPRPSVPIEETRLDGQTQRSECDTKNINFDNIIRYLNGLVGHLLKL